MGKSRYNPTGAFELLPIDEPGDVTNISLTASGVEILTPAKAGREAVLFQNVGTTETAFIEHTSAVTTSGATRGWTLAPGASLSLDAGEDIRFFVIGSGVEADALQAWEL